MERLPDRRGPAGADDGGADPQPTVRSPADLTPRQRQIMELLRAGKVNKEIARELGIGVGTVKQHVVTLFKRLNVSNRTMAVSRGMGLADAPAAGAEPATPAPAAGVLERRPCVLLSLALPARADDAAVRRLHDYLAALAFDMDAVFLARRGNAVDLIFGLHRVGERDLMKAMRSARRLHAHFSAHAPMLADGMHGGVTVGIVVASMLRLGGWSGEAIVSSAIASARELQERAAPGQLALGRPVLELMRALGLGGEGLFGPGAGPGRVALAALAGMDWRGERPSYPLVGRTAELKTLGGLLRRAGAGEGKLVLLEGETGMGKSRLCEALRALCLQAQGRGAFHRVRPDAAQRADAPGAGEAGEIVALLNGLAPGAGGAPALAIVDDCHLLPGEDRRAVLAAARAAAGRGALVLLSGRHMAEAAEADGGGDPGRAVAVTLALRRQSAREIEALVRHVLAPEAPAAGQAQRIAAEAAGVPLFAVELARHRHEAGVALPLLVAVIARLDSLPLDRKLLRVAARRSQPLAAAGIAALLDEPPEAIAEPVARAVAAGVLRAGDDGRLDFGHPLLRKIIDYLALE
ncbi:LuxR C-terminal-related transcriptional regulator [Pseudoduganella namucuonensis]|uniref:AAA ATPase domain-containing protein n=1 Tax=Pseudoduganella namucuonensis TaxID=1035707 RepID=A0A1I7KYF8_9BURK|nr:LuxR C-terminal-related transcriptional regulator [Pseudoduganella namucuonensis]SFV02408.1 AAA ATPase domain-containing protein [Pseudoduganella namucuonensis]